MKFENIDVYNFHNAIRGMRNAYDSWELSDSGWESGFPLNKNTNQQYFKIGPKDLKLMRSLIKAGSSHRKFLRQIMVSVDISAPRFFWQDMDTYCVGVTGNACSTNHSIMKYIFTIDMFDVDNPDKYWELTLEELNRIRQCYYVTRDRKFFYEIKEKLPESFLQKRTKTFSYETLYSMVHDRYNHPLKQWGKMIDFVHTLPYAEELLFFDFIKESDVQ